MDDRGVDTEFHEAGLQSLMAALRRRVGVILLACVSTVCVVTFLNARALPTYEASAALLFGETALGQRSAPLSTDDSLRAAQTNRNLVLLGNVAADASRRIGGRRTPAEVRAEVSIGGDLTSDLVSLRAEDPDPAVAVDLANSYAEAAVAFRQQQARADIRSAQRSVSQELALLRSIRAPTESQRLRITTLQATLSELVGREHLETGNLRLVERATGASKAGLGVIPTAMLAGFGGLLLGVVAALLLEQFDRRLKYSHEIGDAMALPLLGSVPRSRALAGSFTTLPPQETEAFRLLDMNLRFLDSGHPIPSLLLTSVGENEGKTTVALHLAHSWAEAGYDVLLIEADLRKPSLLPAERGLSDYLAGDLELAELWRGSIRVAAPEFGGKEPATDSESAGGHSFHCVPAGRRSSNPLALLATNRMQAALREAEKRFDAVIIDGPPVGVVADAMPLLRMVGGVLVVTRIGSVTRDGLQELRHNLEVSGARVVGVVTNAVKRKRRAPYISLKKG